MTLKPGPLDAALASTRFGLGARPGEIEAARPDPIGYLLAQIRREGGDQPPGELANAADSLRLFREDRARVKALKEKAAAADAAPKMDAPGSGEAMAPAGSKDDMTAAEPMARKAGGDPNRQARREAREPVRDALAAEILARTRLGAETTAGFRERWTLFWSNHFTVSTRKFAAAAVAGPFEREAVRPHVFGRFETLLAATAAHPGMLLYLDQVRSAGPDSLIGRRRELGLNENLAREILELHTVGADAGYTQADVTEFARALTGWSLGRSGDGGGYGGETTWREGMHEPGARTVMGRRYNDDGQGQSAQILLDLARHPKTAARLSAKIARHFVADDPPLALIGRLTAAWTSSQGDLATVAQALVTAPEAWSAPPSKLKTPNDFVLSAYRAAGASPATAQEAVAPLNALGQRPFSAPQPNGWSDASADWATGAGLVRRLDFAAAFAARYSPDQAPAAAADQALGPLASDALRVALSRAETRHAAFALLLMSPEFQRR